VRRIANFLGIGVVLSLAGCGRSETGVHIHAHLGSLEYDELQFRVTRAGGEVVVDPATAGRYQGPFQPGDQDVLVYLRDDLDGTPLHCEASALRAGAVVGSGAGDVTVVRGEMKDVEIFMAAPGSTPSMPDGAPGRPNGEVCSLDAECLTHHCVDGFCCESDCGSACHSCGLADNQGLCRPVAGGMPDPRGKCDDQGAAHCGTSGLCALDGSCALYPAGTACAVAQCADGDKNAVPARSCDGAGRCESPVKIKCGEGATCVAGVCTEVQARQP
jgi:hypothetical protein